MWQDTVIAICQLAFLPAMLPTILGKNKPALSTSLLNMLIVGTIVFALGTLHLWFSVATGLINASAWAILAIQSWRLTKTTK
jgi:hypothetical protein